MTDALFAGIFVALCTFGGCLFGHYHGRKAERRAWCVFVRAQYRANRETKDAGEFRVEMMRKTQDVEKRGWKA